ncbi:prepilin-type N-terminal cleavage/methylation domain-containing protein [Tepidibacillus marianensis]|uniref:prepilin-type N-terminal cleavage/methylation domain-containing protein n=1 Tax=Tepidibacillus marianensis TaxID=3131995 RepID=UPI0030D4C60C
MIRLSDQKGVTLVELLAVVTIMSMIIIAISTVQFQFLDTYKEIHDGSFQNDETSFFIQTFTNQIRNSREIKISGDNKQVELTQEGAIVQFRYDSTAKTITYIKGTQNMVLLKNVTSFTPQRLIQLARVGIQLDIQVQSGKQIVPFQVKVYSFVGTKG